MHIPRAICINCQVEMQTEKIGVKIEMLMENSDPYYKIASDVLSCPFCFNQIAVGMTKPFVESWQETYSKYSVDIIAKLG